jgi:hypothetical protein
LKFCSSEIKEIRQYQFFNNVTLSAPEATVFSKGYKSTITKSICGMSNSSFVEHHFHYLDDLRYLQNFWV